MNSFIWPATSFVICSHCLSGYCC